MKTARQIAELLVDRYLQPDSVTSVGGITATLNNWLNSQPRPDLPSDEVPSKRECYSAAEQFVTADHCKAAFYKGARWAIDRMKGSAKP